MTKKSKIQSDRNTIRVDTDKVEERQAREKWRSGQEDRRQKTQMGESNSNQEKRLQKERRQPITVPISKPVDLTGAPVMEIKTKTSKDFGTMLFKMVIVVLFFLLAGTVWQNQQLKGQLAYTQKRVVELIENNTSVFAVAVETKHETQQAEVATFYEQPRPRHNKPAPRIIRASFKATTIAQVNEPEQTTITEPVIEPDIKIIPTVPATTKAVSESAGNEPPNIYSPVEDWMNPLGFNLFQIKLQVFNPPETGNPPNTHEGGPKTNSFVSKLGP